MKGSAEFLCWRQAGGANGTGVDQQECGCLVKRGPSTLLW